ncbi:hypothetical protein [Thermococcus sp.]|uniref:hypothetical protein n=1 Tax=Thermococcus sp. TaxID=35749 RepID=UPI002609DF25|nr:hypothetical protein [Thermococcus sp.]
MVPPVPIRRGYHRKPPRPEDAENAIELVKQALPLFIAGKPLERPDHVDVPVLYLGFAIDAVHYDPAIGGPAPKGAPPVEKASPEEALESISRALSEAHVLEGAEFREPEDSWVVPVSWRGLIVLHVRVSADGKKLIPDYHLTEEVRRHGL